MELTKFNIGSFSKEEEREGFCLYLNKDIYLSKLQTKSVIFNARLSNLITVELFYDDDYSISSYLIYGEINNLPSENNIALYAAYTKYESLKKILKNNDGPTSPEDMLVYFSVPKGTRYYNYEKEELEVNLEIALEKFKNKFSLKSFIEFALIVSSRNNFSNVEILSEIFLKFIFEESSVSEDARNVSELYISALFNDSQYGFIFNYSRTRVQSLLLKIKEVTPLIDVASKISIDAISMNAHRSLRYETVVMGLRTFDYLSNKNLELFNYKMIKHSAYKNILINHLFLKLIEFVKENKIELSEYLYLAQTRTRDNFTYISNDRLYYLMLEMLVDEERYEEALKIFDLYKEDNDYSDEYEKLFKDISSLLNGEHFLKELLKTTFIKSRFDLQVMLTRYINDESFKLILPSKIDGDSLDALLESCPDIFKDYKNFENSCLDGNYNRIYSSLCEILDKVKKIDRRVINNFFLTPEFIEHLKKMSSVKLSKFVPYAIEYGIMEQIGYVDTGDKLCF